ncbi:hypothetical protein Tco_1113717 [Tanacetum coccineum]|uniref:Reverse transcriptase domain-containing protein n=1 Tax=Tanacetum coccineum TaxID=301880 RepID=A0ABQ5IT90_9ASTR
MEIRGTVCSNLENQMRPTGLLITQTTLLLDTTKDIMQNQGYNGIEMLTKTVKLTMELNRDYHNKAQLSTIGLSYTPVPPSSYLYDVNEPLTEKETEVTKDKVLPSTKAYNSGLSKKSHGSVSGVEHEKKGENDKVQIQKFWEMFKKIHVDITLADALILMPKYQKMLKSLLSNKEKLNEMANTPVSETCSAIILKKLPEKLGDHGQERIEKTKKKQKQSKTDKERKRQDKSKEAVKDQSRISPTQQERQSKVKIMKSRT